METKKEVKTYSIDYVCEECGDGNMRPEGHVLTTYPARYPHKCTSCGHMETFKITYPHVITE